MAEAGDVVSICQLCRLFDMPRRTFHYRQVKQKPKVNEVLAGQAASRGLPPTGPKHAFRSVLDE